jgi:hypothetical protein
MLLPKMQKSLLSACGVRLCLITARQIFQELNKAEKAKVMDYLRANPTSKKIFRVDFKEAFYEDLLKRRDGAIAQHIITNTFGETGCLSKDTKLLFGKSLDEFQPNTQLKTFSYDFWTGKMIPSESIITDSGLKQTYRIRTSDGRIIDATADHKLFRKTPNGFEEVEVSKLKKGDKLVRF